MGRSQDATNEYAKEKKSVFSILTCQGAPTIRRGRVGEELLAGSPNASEV